MHRAAFALLAWPLAVQAVDELDRVLLPSGQYVGGKCMDGSPAGYYYGPPSSGSSTLWVLFLKGGGGCRTQEDCAKWAQGDGGKKGGSTNWEAQMSVGGLLSSSAAINPDFHDAHHVYVPYCTGDSHTGQVSSPTEADQWGYYFDGHLNVKAIAHHIYTTIAAAPQMQRVLFAGSSAGGRGVFFNCDFLQDYLTQLGASVSVMCSPRTGWFMPGNVQEGANPKDPPTHWDYWSVGSLAPDTTQESPHDPYLHPDCVAAEGADASNCMSVHNLYQYIKAPIYAIQDTFDTNIVFAQLELPETDVSSPEGREYVAYIGNCTKASMGQIAVHPKGKSGDGMFLTSCLNHGSGASIQGKNKDEGLGDWFFGRNASHLVSMDTCDSQSPYLPCNPGCKGLPQEGACQAELEGLCGTSTTRKQCMECARDNRFELGAVGCTKTLVLRVCKPGFADGAPRAQYTALIVLATALWVVV